MDRSDNQPRSGKALPPVWLTPTQTTARHRRKALDRDQIVVAAIRIVDGEGIDALTMRRLAVELGAGATSVYRHVRDRAELLDLALDAVTAELELPDTNAAWRDALALTAHRLRALFHRHPNFVLVRGTRVAFGPHSLGALERVLGILRTDGFPDRDALFAASTLVNYTLGFTLLELLPLLQLEAEGQDPGEYLQLLGAFVGALPVAQYANLVALTPLMLGREDAEFDYGVEALLRGISSLRQMDGATGPGRS